MEIWHSLVIFPCYDCSPFSLNANDAETACFTNALLLLKMPVSKFLVFLPFIPSPAPVRSDEPTYAVFKSKMMILKCMRGQSTRSMPSIRFGYLSKSFRNADPGSFVWIRRISTPRFTRSDKTSKSGFAFRPSFTYKSLMSAVPIHSVFRTLSIRLITFS